jgi:hypothetical protein
LGKGVVCSGQLQTEGPVPHSPRADARASEPHGGPCCWFPSLVWIISSVFLVSGTVHVDISSPAAMTSGDEVKNSSAPHIFLDSPRYLEARPMEVLWEVGKGSRYLLTIRPGCSCPQRARTHKQGKLRSQKTVENGLVDASGITTAVKAD